MIWSCITFVLNCKGILSDVSNHLLCTHDWDKTFPVLCPPCSHSVYSEIMLFSHVAHGNANMLGHRPEQCFMEWWVRDLFMWQLCNESAILGQSLGTDVEITKLPVILVIHPCKKSSWLNRPQANPVSSEPLSHLVVQLLRMMPL